MLAARDPPHRLLSTRLDPETLREKIRFAVAYDVRDCDPGQSDTLWQIVFDHSASIAGTDADPATCDRVDAPFNFYVTSLVLLHTGDLQDLARLPEDRRLTWNGGVSDTRARRVTWGQIKGLYR